MESFDLEDPFTSLKEEQSGSTAHLQALFSSESFHMPSQNYLQCLKTNPFYASIRQEALSFIILAQYSCDLDPLTRYLALNYLDRFLSAKQIPEDKPWILRLLVTCCISVSAKMKGGSFSASNFLQNAGGFIFDEQTIHRMELLILDVLKWRMRSITPFSFLCFFISFLEPQDPPLLTSLKDRAVAIVFKAQTEIDLLEFNPSSIAASAILSATSELLPSHLLSFKASILSCEYVNKENVLKSLRLMQETVTGERSESDLDRTSSSKMTAVSVLDGIWTESESENSAVTAAEERAIKRRKMNSFCDGKEDGSLCDAADREFPPTFQDSST